MTATTDCVDGRGPSAPRGPRIYAHCWTLLSVMGPLEAARFAAKNGFAGLEMFCNPRDFWPGLIPGATLDALGAIGRDEGIEYSLYGCYTNNAATRLRELKALDTEIMKHTLEVAAHVGAKTAVDRVGNRISPLAVRVTREPPPVAPFTEVEVDRLTGLVALPGPVFA